MECVILWRNTQNGAVGFLSQENRPEEIAVFAHIDEAIQVADAHHLCRAFPYQIVELEEL